MYKSKLQELCQQKAWRLPEYTTAKQGLDHCPCFQGTVTINGLSFITQNLCKSSKQAQNDAAKLAFDHFSSLPKSQPPSASPGSSSANDVGSNLPTKGTLQLGIQEKSQTPHINGTASVVKQDGIRDIQHLYKNQLQNYAQKRNLSLPLYSCEREGPPHASRFKCKVTIDGQTYENPEFFSTVKEAEHAAAQFALLSLSPNGVQEDDSGFYKNLLQELAQKEGYLLPAYNTEKSGEAHTPAFVSTVEVGGEVFTGPEAKTKKQAEMNAAKVAYVTLKESESSQKTFPSVFPQPGFGPIAPEISASSIIPEKQAEDRGNVDVSSPSPVTFSGGIRGSSSSAPIAGNVDVSSPSPVTFSGGMGGSSSSDPFAGNVDVSCPSTVTFSGGMGGSSSSDPFAGNVDVSSPSPVTFSGGIRDSMIEPPPEKSPKKYKTRIIVRPRVPNMTFPVNATVLPMNDENWVAMRIGPEPNQK